MTASGPWYRSYPMPLALALVAFLIIVTGGWVRITDAGESCPDWPTCFGRVHPFVGEAQQEAWWAAHPDEPRDTRGAEYRYSYDEIFTEWFHRLLAGVVGFAVLYSHYHAWRRSQVLGRELHLAHARATGLLLVQALAGYATVDLDNVPWSVALHLALALGFTVALLWTGLLWWQRERGLPPPLALPAAVAKEWRMQLLGLTLALGGLLMVGAWLATGFYRDGCSVGWYDGWPLCQGALLPNLAGRPVQVQLLHRGLALAVAALLGGVAWRLRDGPWALARLSQAAFILLVGNALVGGLYIVLAAEGDFVGALSLLHLILGSLALLALAIAWLLCVAAESAQEPPAEAELSAVGAERP